MTRTELHSALLASPRSQWIVTDHHGPVSVSARELAITMSVDEEMRQNEPLWLRYTLEDPRE